MIINFIKHSILPLPIGNFGSPVNVPEVIILIMITIEGLQDVYRFLVFILGHAFSYPVNGIVPIALVIILVGVIIVSV